MRNENRMYRTPVINAKTPTPSNPPTRLTRLNKSRPHPLNTNTPLRPSQKPPLNTRNLLTPRPRPRPQRRPGHKLRRLKAYTTLINTIPTRPKLKTSPANPVPAFRQQDLNDVPTHDAGVAEVCWEGDGGVLATAFDFAGEFFAFFDARAEEVDFLFEG